jgi:hypothetical protein
MAIRGMQRRLARLEQIVSGKARINAFRRPIILSTVSPNGEISEVKYASAGNRKWEREAGETPDEFMNRVTPLVGDDAPVLFTSFVDAEDRRAAELRRNLEERRPISVRGGQD